MPGGKNRKRWDQMTHSEIVASLIAYTVIGGAIMAVLIRAILLSETWNGWMLLWPGAGMLFVFVFLGIAYSQALRELARRKSKA